MATEIWVNIGSSNGLVPDGTKPLPESWANVAWSSAKSSDIHIGAISQEKPQPSITKIHLKITYLKFLSNFPGANKLNDDRDLWCLYVLSEDTELTLPCMYQG